MTIIKTVTYQGNKFKLRIMEQGSKFYNEVYKAEIDNLELGISTQNTFISAKQLEENLSDWIRVVVSQSSSECRVLSALEEWDGVIE